MANTLGGRVTGGPGGPARSPNDTRVSEREDLANFISMITRDETPFMSSIGKTKATAIYHEWQTDALETPGDSRIPEGQDWAVPGGTGITPAVGSQFNVVGPSRSRLGNYTQINGKTMAVSGTKRAVDQAGVADEYAYQLKKRGTEMRRDIESDLVNTGNFSAPTGAQAGGARTMGGYQSFINNTSTVRLVGGTTVSGSNDDHDGTGQVSLAISCLLYTSPSPRDRQKSRMPSSA